MKKNWFVIAIISIVGFTTLAISQVSIAEDVCPLCGAPLK